MLLNRLIPSLHAGLPCAMFLAVLGSGLLAADQVSDVPDPYGLGERLALIDWLHTHAIQVSADATVEDLRSAYRLAIAPTSSTATGEADQRAALERELWVRYGKTSSEHATIDDLKALLAKMDTQRVVAQHQELDQEEQDAARSILHPASEHRGDDSDGRPVHHATSAATPQVQPSSSHEERKYQDAGYQFVSYSAPLTLYIKPHQEGEMLTIPLAIWNDGDSPCGVDFKVWGTSGRPTEVNVTIAPHTAYERTFAFGGQVMGSKADACFLQVKQP